MEETLKFLEDCDNFWSWLENPDITLESLEEYANTGILPPQPVYKTPRVWDKPPKGDFKEGSAWFHPDTQQMYLWNRGQWHAVHEVKSRNKTVKEPDTTIQDVKKAAKANSIHCYYQGITQQFVFSRNGDSWTETLEGMKDHITRGILESYFAQFTGASPSYKRDALVLETEQCPSPCQLTLTSERK
jgi:hypothetical protein